MKSGPFIDGIPALGPGETRRIDWGQYGGLLKNFGTEPAIVTCKFKKNGKPMPPMEFKIDIKSFEGTVAARSSEAIVAKELESISKDLHNIATGFSRLKINIVEDEVFGLLKEKGEAYRDREWLCCKIIQRAWRWPFPEIFMRQSETGLR